MTKRTRRITAEYARTLAGNVKELEITEKDKPERGKQCEVMWFWLRH